MRLFPCVLRHPDGTTRTPVKVDSTTTGTVVYGWADGTGEVIYETAHPIERRRQIDHYSLTLDDGTVLHVEKVCGCAGYGAHPLRGWLPAGVPRGHRVEAGLFTGTPT